MKKLQSCLILLIFIFSTIAVSGISKINDNKYNINLPGNINTEYFPIDQVSWTKSNTINNPSGWSTTEIVTIDSDIDSWFPAIYVDSAETAHIVWNERSNYGSSGLDDDIFYKSKPKGGSWTTTEVVSTESTADSWLSTIIVDSDNTIHVTWEDWTDFDGSGIDFDIFYKYKPSGGSWSQTEVVSVESNQDSSVSSLAVDNLGTVHVTWIDGTDYNGAGSDVDIFYKSKPKDGSWTPAEVISIESTENSWNPCLIVDSDATVHVTWEDWTNIAGSGPDWDVYYKYKDSSGLWSAIETISTESDYDSWFSSLGIDSKGTLHVAWQDFSQFGGSSYDSDIVYKYKPIDGSWSTTEIVSSESTGNSGKPTLAVDYSDTLHVVWEDVTDISGSGYDSDIFYKSKENGGNWTTTEVVSTESNLVSWISTLDVDSSKTVHVAWVDATDIDKIDNSIPDLDIFYKYKIGEPGPYLQIHSLSGGFGISAEIKNIGDSDATDINWNINLDGRFILFGKENTGNIDHLLPEQSEIITTGLIIGLGKATITLSAECSEGPSDEKTSSGFLILPFIIGVK